MQSVSSRIWTCVAVSISYDDDHYTTGTSINVVYYECQWWIISVCVITYLLIGPVGRVFANGPGDRGSIPGRVIPKTLKKWYLIPPCLTLSIIRYVSRVKWSNPGKGVVPSPTLWCSSYCKRSLQVALDYCCQLYFLFYIPEYDPS